jgi:dipicolinate synthase subunit B
VDKKRIGFGLTGSFRTVDQVIPMINEIKLLGHIIIPIVSNNLQSVDTRFGSSAHFLTEIEKCAEYKPVTSMVEAEGLGPSRPLDALVIAPMTGTSLSKFSQGISDSLVLFAAKATLRGRSGCFNE